MELSEDEVLISKSSDFFDFVCPKTGVVISSQNSSDNSNSCDTSEGPMTPLPTGPNSLFTDPLMDPYPPSDPNNNNLIHHHHQSGPIKSFLDEILLQAHPPGDEDGPGGNGTLELLGTFTWVNADDPSLIPLNPPLLDHQDGAWDPGSSEVTTLTNLLDPLFVSFEESSNKLDSYFIGSGGGIGEDSTHHCTVISSDLISSTFLNDPSPTITSSITSSSEESEGLTIWQKSDSPSILSQESLLRTALQSSKGKHDPEMTELRKVLSFPPLRSTDEGDYPSSPSSSSQNHQGLQQSHLIISEGESPYYELKVLDSVFVDQDALIPNNVEELVLSRLHPLQQQQEVNSTTSSATMTTKWTYIPQNSNSQSSGANSKVVRRRVKKVTKVKEEPDKMIKADDLFQHHRAEDEGEGGEGQSPGGGQGGRKERSLHYCTICSKGFKDKYSVNVHVRTHTGEKPFSCTLCGKNFRQKAHLAKHYQTHAAKAAAAGNSHPKGSNNKNRNNNTQQSTTNASS